MKSRPQFCVLFNPGAGSSEQLDVLRSSMQRLGTVTYIELEEGYDWDRLAEEVTRGSFDVVVIAGGDGTVNRVVNSLEPVLSKTTFAVVPLGTGNDLCRTLAIPLDLPEAVQTLRQVRQRRIDLIRVVGSEAQFCVNAATGGISGEVTAGLTGETKKLWGPLAYLRGAVVPMSVATVYRVTLTADRGPTERLELHNLVVANGRTAAGGVTVAPRASIEDGLLEVVIIRAGSTLDMAVVAARIMAGDYDTDECVERRRCRHLVIESEPPMPLSIDGDVVVTNRYEFTIVPHALPICTGPDYHPYPITEKVDEEVEPGGPVGGSGERTFRQRVFAVAAAVLLSMVRWSSVYTVGLTIALVSAVLFGALCRQVMSGSMKEVDQDVYLAIRSMANPQLDRVVHALTQLGSAWLVIPLAVVILLVYAARKRYLDAATFVAAVVGCWVLELTLKAVFGVPRPEPLPGIDLPFGHSFPSGHVMRAGGLYGTVAALLIVHHPRVVWRWLAALGLFSIIVLVGWSRLYLGVHWLSDVIGGVLTVVAWLSACLVVRANVRTRSRKRGSGATASGDHREGGGPEAVAEVDTNSR